MNQNFQNRWMLYAGINTYLICGSILVAFTLMESLHITSITTILLLGLGLATVLKSAFYRLESQRPAMKTILLSELAFVAFAITLGIICSHFYDYSWDGRYYHQEGIIQLCQGYNPFYQQLDETLVNGGIWINHYPKAVEIVSATLYAVTGDIEIGKVQNLLFLFSNTLVGYWLITSIVGFNKIKSLIFSVLIAANPVVLSQVLTYYVDGQMYSLMVATSYLLVIILYDRQWKWFLVLAPLVFFLANIKFTASVYLAMMLLMFCVAPFIFRQVRHAARNIVMTGILFAVAVALIGFNPYVTNFKIYGHPFYPVFGSNSLDLITDQAPQEFHGLNRVSKAFRSYFGETDNILEKSGDRVRMKLPLTFSREEVKRLEVFDLRIGGFGPLFGGLVLLAVGLYAFFVFHLFTRPGTSAGNRLSASNYPLEIVALFFLVTAVCNPEFWWARYTPQLWLVPILLLMAVSSRIDLITSLARIPIAIALLNIAMFVGVLARSNVLRTNAVNDELLELQKSQTPIQVYFDHRDADRIKLETFGIPYTELHDRNALTGKFQNRLFRSAIIAHENPQLADLLPKL